jgi:hypothetical protein
MKPHESSATDPRALNCATVSAQRVAEPNEHVTLPTGISQKTRVQLIKNQEKLKNNEKESSRKLFLP